MVNRGLGTEVKSSQEIRDQGEGSGERGRGPKNFGRIVGRKLAHVVLNSWEITAFAMQLNSHFFYCQILEKARVMSGRQRRLVRSSNADEDDEAIQIDDASRYEDPGRGVEKEDDKDDGNYDKLEDVASHDGHRNGLEIFPPHFLSCLISLFLAAFPLQVPLKTPSTKLEPSREAFTTSMVHPTPFLPFRRSQLLSTFLSRCLLGCVRFFDLH